MKVTKLLPPVEKSIHTGFKAWCNQRGSIMTRELERLITAEMAANPAAGITVNTPSGASPARGRPPGNKAFVRCDLELNIMKLGTPAELEAEALKRERVVAPIVIKLRSTGRHFEPEGFCANVADTPTLQLCYMANAAELVSPIIDAGQFEMVMAPHGLPSLVVVKKTGDNSYEPANHLADLLMAFYPGRKTFDAASLAFFVIRLEFKLEITQ